MGYNRVLGNPDAPEVSRPHRVAIASWPTMVKDPRTASLDALLSHINSSGYEGLEFNVGAYTRFFPGDSNAVVARKARTQVEKAGLKIFGSSFYPGDGDMRKLRWTEPWVEELKLVQDMGGEFANFQIGLHPDYMNTGGAQREDEDYLKWSAEKLAEIRDKTWSLGLNFYLEVHILKITVDPAALCRILEMTDCELCGDMSHYIARGFTKGNYVKKIIDHVHYMHVRMARTHGDLSAVVEDPKADWESKGLTWQLFQFQKPALAHGLSSRTISGETGPMHLVKDTLDQDAALVPYFRAMARFADAAAQGIVMKVEEPGDLKPWG